MKSVSHKVEAVRIQPCYFLLLYVSVFSISLVCTGEMSTEVDIRIQMNVSIFSVSNQTTLDIKRRKTCLKQHQGERRGVLFFSWFMLFVYLHICLLVSLLVSDPFLCMLYGNCVYGWSLLICYSFPVSFSLALSPRYSHVFGFDTS